MTALRKLRPRTLWDVHLGPSWGPLPEMLLTLTLVTGVVDAVSILALGRVFVANMTGNVVFAAFAAVELAFAAVALVIAATSGDPGVTHGTIGLAGGEFGAAVTDTLAALLALALGVQNAVARRLAVPDMTTTVLTMTLTGVGADIRAVFGEEGRVQGAARTAARGALGRRLLAVAAMVIGAIAGASLTLRVSPLAGLALATALLAAVTAWVALATRRPASWRADVAAKR